MSLDMEEVSYDTTPSDGELVHWMAPGRLQVGAAGLAVAFGLGLAAAVGVLMAIRWVGPRREGLPPWKWSRGPVH